MYARMHVCMYACMYLANFILSCCCTVMQNRSKALRVCCRASHRVRRHTELRDWSSWISRRVCSSFHGKSFDEAPATPAVEGGGQRVQA